MRKKFKTIRENIVKNVALFTIDKWVTATVTVMSIRESMSKIEIMVRGKMDKYYGFEALRTNWRHICLIDSRRAAVHRHSAEQRVALITLILHEWRSIIWKKSEERIRIDYMSKLLFFKRLRSFSETRIEKNLMEKIADEFLLSSETHRITGIIETAVDCWRILVESSRELKEKYSIISELARLSKLAISLHEWRYLLDISVYKSDIDNRGNELKSRIEFRTKTKAFNGLILKFLDFTKNEKLAIDFQYFLQKRRVISALKNVRAFQRKYRYLESIKNKKIIEVSFHLMYREVYLRFKERIGYRQIHERSAVRKLSLHAQYRRNRTLMKTFSNWKKDRMAVEETRNLSVIFSSWRVVTNEAKLVKLYLNPQKSGPPSYRDIRSRSVSVTPPKTGRATSDDDSDAYNSYRQIRPEMG
jgi:hypothetical protein